MEKSFLNIMTYLSKNIIEIGCWDPADAGLGSPNGSMDSKIRILNNPDQQNS